MECLTIFTSELNSQFDNKGSSMSATKNLLILTVTLLQNDLQRLNHIPLTKAIMDYLTWDLIVEGDFLAILSPVR